MSERWQVSENEALITRGETSWWSCKHHDSLACAHFAAGLLHANSWISPANLRQRFSPFFSFSLLPLVADSRHVGGYQEVHIQGALLVEASLALYLALFFYLSSFLK